jgi:hypothetical protein
MDPVSERFLAKAEEYARLAEQAHDPAIARQYHELARRMRELAVRPAVPGGNPAI